MKIRDKIYGEQEINQKIFVDLISSKSIQRLRDISQLGVPDEYSHVKGFSRYEHSIGVMLLLNKLGADIEEQVAGLLHDVSHTPFSHVIDWVFGDPTKEDYQDKIHGTFLKNSEIPNILRKHSFNLESISNYDNFKLLERDAPSLCADRLDYSLRQMKKQDEMGLIEKILGNLSVKENQIVFNNEKIAKIFGEEYMTLQREQWAGDEMRSRYYLLSQVLKEAFKEKLINLEDLRRTEGHILNILNKSKNKFILENLNTLKKGFQVAPDEEGIELKKKFRYIDPEVLVNGNYLPLSHLSQEYSNLIQAEKINNLEVRKIKIIPN